MQTSLSLEFWLIVFIICLAILAVYYIFFFLKRREEKKMDNYYLMGLKYMAEGENRRAVRAAAPRSPTVYAPSRGR